LLPFFLFMESEYQDFIEESMAEASGKENMGVVFVVSGKELVGVPAPLTVEVETTTSAQQRKSAISLMIPCPMGVTSKDLMATYHKGLVMIDSRGRSFKVYRYEEKRMALEIFMIDINR